MGNDILDKVIAYGNGSPGSDGATTTPIASSIGGSSFFGGAWRTFSGSAITTNTTTATTSVTNGAVGGASNESGGTKVTDAQRLEEQLSTLSSESSVRASL